MQPASTDAASSEVMRGRRRPRKPSKEEQQSGVWYPRWYWPSFTIVGIVCDGGWKYLSSGLWTDDVDAVEDRVDNGIFW